MRNGAGILLLFKIDKREEELVKPPHNLFRNVPKSLP